MRSISPKAGRTEGSPGVIRSHFLNMVIFSALVAVFFAFLTQNETRDRVRISVIIGGSMVVLSLIVAYVMYPFPLR